ncbi:MAG TPA: tetratricopeptide repeat protein [Bacteroidales bacterium]|nr:tetratricopeptide repeat protein [Bacteroidales bacterium]HRR03864.1 tetratricopeptide repeat protein [Bacteroidales bacterium]HRT14304.1 tetratricopeptide repeat protein [Bacteroidales bacterium]
MAKIEKLGAKKTEKLGAKKGEKVEKKKNAFSRFIDFYNNNQKILSIILIVILVAIGAIIAFKKFYLEPQNKKAAALMVEPIKLFAQGDSVSIRLALEGDDDVDGFETIASDFTLTKAGNSANYYTGLCYLKLGEKEDALEYLLKFKRKEDVLWYHVQGIIGDLYDEMDDETNALKYYKRACESENAFYAPIDMFKLAQFYESQEEWEEAYNLYQQIENKFYSQFQNMNVDKYMERARINAEK